MRGGGDAIGMVLCVLVFALPIGLLIGAVILRAAVSFANKCLPQPRSRYDDDYDDWDDDYRPRSRRRAPAGAIPEPSMGQAMLIVFVNMIVGFVVSIPINVAMGVGFAGQGGGNDPAASIIASLIQLPIGFLIAAGVLTAMLPTTFPRACLVVVFEYLIVIGICVIIAVPLFLLAFAARA